LEGSGKTGIKNMKRRMAGISGRNKASMLTAH
jgi:hypothetical protein